MIPTILPTEVFEKIFGLFGPLTLGIALLVFAVITLSLAYHWFRYERANPFIYIGAVVYGVGSFLLIANVWAAFSLMNL